MHGNRLSGVDRAAAAHRNHYIASSFPHSWGWLRCRCCRGRRQRDRRRKGDCHCIATNGGEPLDFLEVVGKGARHRLPPLPFIAVPTTAGTGSEVTRNAVLASPEHGVKASLRSPMMLPRVALVDPELTYALPPAITANTGLDALTQLIEPYVSARANPITDALCVEGISRAAGALGRVYRDGADHEARREMALASLSEAWRWPTPDWAWCTVLPRRWEADGMRRMERSARRCCRTAWPPTLPPCGPARRSIRPWNATPPLRAC